MLTGCTSHLLGPPNFDDRETIVGAYHPRASITLSAIFLNEMGGVAADGNSGFILGCTAINNTNDQPEFYRAAYQLFLVAPNGTATHLVQVDESRVEDEAPAHFDDSGPTGIGAGGIQVRHLVPLNETAEGSTKYAIRFWTDVIDPFGFEARKWNHVEPTNPPLSALHFEKWINITYTPFASMDLYHEGGQCK
jgi:hypothetical protein